MKEHRLELFEQFRAAPNGSERRKEICIELDKLFLTRAQWQQRHNISYNYAKKHDIIAPKNCRGWRNGKPTDSTQNMTIEQSRIRVLAKARDEIHAHCKSKKLDYNIEKRMGDVLIDYMRRGKSIDTAMAAAFAVAA